MNKKQRLGWFQILVFLIMMFGVLLGFSINADSYLLITVFGSILAVVLLLTAILVNEDKDERRLKDNINKKRRKMN